MENNELNEPGPTVQEPTVTQTVSTKTVTPKKAHKLWHFVLPLVVLVLVVGVAAMLLHLRNSNNANQQNTQNNPQSQSVDLASVAPDSASFKISESNKIVFNGEIQATQGLVLVPTDEPAAAILGQLYVDQDSKEIKFYNGDSFVSLLTSESNLITADEVQALIAANTPAEPTDAVNSLQGRSGTLSLVGTGGLTVSTNGNNITLNLPQNLTITANPTFAGLTVTSLDGNGVVVSNNSTLQSVTAVSPGLCLVSTAGLPTFDSCVGGGASVASLNGLTGALILANSTGAGDTITINNASTSAKGIARFNATNFSVSSGTVNTIQDIATTSTPTFAGVLTSSLDRANAGTLTIGATNATAISLNQNTTITGSHTFTTGTGAVNLNGPTTVATDQSFSAYGIALFKSMTDSDQAFRIQNAGGTTILGVDSMSTVNLVSTNSSFDTSNPNVWSDTPGPGVCTTPAQDDTDGDGDVDGDDQPPPPNCVDPWIAVGNPTPVPSTFERDAENSVDNSSGSLHIVNNGGSVQGAAYPIVLTPATYTLRFSARSNQGTQAMRMGYYTGSNLTTRVESSCTSSAYTLPNPNNSVLPWRTLTCTFTVASTAAGIYIRSNSNNGDWNLDKVILQTGSTFKPLNNGLINANAATVVTVDSDSAFRVQRTDGAYALLNVDTEAGLTVFRARTNDTNTLQVQNADGSLVFNVKAGVAGNLSAWKRATNRISATSPFGRANFQAATTVTSTGDTYAYVVGGTPTNANKVQYAKLVGNGGEVWNAGNGTGLPDGLQSGGTVTAKGYIYYIGGQDSSNSSLNTVYYNKIASDGSMTGDWQLSDKSLGTARTQVNALYYNGYIYVFGGAASSSGSAITSIERAQVNADGSLGNWTASGNLATAAKSYGVAQSNGYIYVVGGNGLTTVQYAQVGGGGSLGSWNATASLPSARSSAAVVLANGYMYVISGNGSSTVYYGAVSASGGVEWSPNAGNTADSFGTLVSRSNLSGFAYNNTVYFLGGTTPSPATTHGWVYYASAAGNSSHVSIDGSLSVTRDATFSGSLNVINAVNTTSAFQVANSQGGQILNVDTLNSAITLNGINSGELRNWLTTTELDNGRAAHGAVAVNGYIYAVSGSSSDTVSYAKIKTDGSLGEWEDNAVNLPDYKNFAGVAASNGYIYVVGGYDSASNAPCGDSTCPSNKIYYGKPSTDGTISAWKTSSNNLNTAVGAPAVSIVNGYMYVTGGAQDSSSGVPSDPTNVVQYAKLNPDGSLGSFTVSGNSLPEDRMGGRSAVANGYLYFTGGAASNGDAQDDVYFASLAGDGSVDSWTSTNSNPNSKAYHTAFILNGYLYLLGGTSSSYGSASTQSVNFGKLEGDGDITQWFTATEPLLDTVQSHASVVANGYVYVLGGYGPSKIVMFATASRVSVGGSLDLVGLGSRTLSDAGGGGELTAGNTSIIGTLDVRNAATFSQSLAVNGIFTAHDDVLIQSDNNSANAFQVQNSSGTVLLGVNAAAGQINANADMLFGDINNIYVNNIIQTADGQDLNIDAGNNVITFTAGGRTFILPTTGPSAQTICTTGISCAEGGGQAVLLASGSAQTNNTTDSAIFINATSTGKHIQLQSAGTDVFVISHTGVLTLGTPGSVEGSIVFSDGNSSYSATLNVGTLTANRTFSFPDAVSGEICISSGNCAGAGSGVTAPVAGTTNRIAKFVGGQAIGDSNISDDGTAVTIQGSDGLVLGEDSTINGRIRFWYAGGSYSVVLETGGLTDDQTITLPDASGEICVSSGNCFGSGSGATLQAAYNAGNSITTTDNRNINFTLADTSTDSNFVINIQGSNAVKFQDGGTDIFTVADGGVFTLKSTSNSSTAFVLQNNSDVALLTADTSAMKLKIGTGTPTLGSATSGGLFVTDAAEFAGTIRIGDGTDNATFDSTTKQLRFTGAARNTKRISLSAEYVGAVLDGSGIGTMTAGYDSSNRINYYKWTTSQASNQTYDIIVQVTIPNDFSAWAASNPLGISVYSSTTTACSIGVVVVDTAGSNQGATACTGNAVTDITPSSTSTWQVKNPSILSSGSYTPGSVMTIKLRLTSPNGGDIRVGRIYMDYLSTF